MVAIRPDVPFVWICCIGSVCGHALNDVCAILLYTEADRGAISYWLIKTDLPLYGLLKFSRLLEAAHQLCIVKGQRAINSSVLP